MTNTAAPPGPDSHHGIKTIIILFLSLWPLIVKTQILKCNISHRRLFPAKNAFVYSFLSVGIPVRRPSSNWFLSVDTVPWWRRCLLHVTARDHLDGGSEVGSLSELLDIYLRKQGLEPDDFPQVYLLTAPRVFGYRFSPASFWYLYTASSCLFYVIAEVNNTFNERRMYLFSATDSRGDTLTQRCAKDFHVSPFNSRKGAYRLYAHNPASRKNVLIKVGLYSSKGYPKLWARWWSTGPAIDPSVSSVLSLLWCLVSWGFASSLTCAVPRIVFQATILAQVHKLSIWYRPEPRESTIARRATPPEKFVASIFIRYLRYLLSSSPMDCVVVVRATGCDQDCIIPPTPGPPEPQHSPIVEPAYIEMRIHTPKFYRQVTSNVHLTELLQHTLLSSWEENRTVWSNDPQGLMMVLQAAYFARLKERNTRLPGYHNPLGLLGQLLWRAHTWLLCSVPLSGSYPSPGLPKERRGGSHKAPHSSRSGSHVTGFSLHDFVREHCSPLCQVRYMLTTLLLQWRARAAGFLGGE
ncbi:hypothetical protein GGR56DRAFT_684050 [Xylariaceae sp. FL0804]|nr:hypothetical protein GGR56DRAFT_684050 [Xylariaceae sp. FL0804]